MPVRQLRPTSAPLMPTPAHGGSVETVCPALEWLTELASEAAPR
jgi:hypothetical protein